jgi:hypothetical protein
MRDGSLALFRRARSTMRTTVWGDKSSVARLLLRRRILTQLRPNGTGPQCGTDLSAVANGAYETCQQQTAAHMCHIVGAQLPVCAFK